MRTLSLLFAPCCKGIRLPISRRYMLCPLGCPGSTLKGLPTMQVLAQDYPKPAFETSGPYLEAAALSAQLREAPRPERPLRVVIAGAGSCAAGLHARWCMR